MPVNHTGTDVKWVGPVPVSHRVTDVKWVGLVLILKVAGVMWEMLVPANHIRANLKIHIPSVRTLIKYTHIYILCKQHHSHHVYIIHLPGGYSNMSTPRQGNSPLTSATSSSSDRGQDRGRGGSRVTSQRSEEMMLFRKRAKSGAPHPPPKPSGREAESVDTSNVNLGFEGEPSRSAGKVKGGTLSESRRRIAEAVGRT